jgi:hypothetical protein
MISTETEVQLLTELDFPVPCGHSRHDVETPWHRGHARYVAVSYHDCSAVSDCPAPYFYPCCEAWAQFVWDVTARGDSVECVRCGEHALWSDLVAIVGTLT